MKNICVCLVVVMVTGCALQSPEQYMPGPTPAGEPFDPGAYDGVWMANLQQDEGLVRVTVEGDMVTLLELDMVSSDGQTVDRWPLTVPVSRSIAQARPRFDDGEGHLEIYFVFDQDVLAGDLAIFHSSSRQPIELQFVATREGEP